MMKGLYDRYTTSKESTATSKKVNGKAWAPRINQKKQPVKKDTMKKSKTGSTYCNVRQFPDCLNNLISPSLSRAEKICDMRVNCKGIVRRRESGVILY